MFRLLYLPKRIGISNLRLNRLNSFSSRLHSQISFDGFEKSLSSSSNSTHFLSEPAATVFHHPQTLKSKIQALLDSKNDHSSYTEKELRKIILSVTALGDNHMASLALNKFIKIDNMTPRLLTLIFICQDRCKLPHDAIDLFKSFLHNSQQNHILNEQHLTSILKICRNYDLRIGMKLFQEYTEVKIGNQGHSTQISNTNNLSVICMGAFLSMCNRFLSLPTIKISTINRNNNKLTQITIDKNYIFQYVLSIQHQIPIHITTYSSFLIILAKYNRFDLVQSSYKTMLDAGIEPNITILNSLITSSIITKNYEFAYTLFESNPSQHNSKLITSMINLCIKTDQQQKGLLLFLNWVVRNPLEYSGDTPKNPSNHNNRMKDVRYTRADVENYRRALGSITDFAHLEIPVVRGVFFLLQSPAVDRELSRIALAFLKGILLETPYVLGSPPPFNILTHLACHVAEFGDVEAVLGAAEDAVKECLSSEVWRGENERKNAEIGAEPRAQISTRELVQTEMKRVVLSMADSLQRRKAWPELLSLLTRLETYQSQELISNILRGEVLSKTIATLVDCGLTDKANRLLELKFSYFISKEKLFAWKLVKALNKVSKSSFCKNILKLAYERDKVDEELLVGFLEEISDLKTIHELLKMKQSDGVTAILGKKLWTNNVVGAMELCVVKNCKRKGDVNCIIDELLFICPSLSDHPVVVGLLKRFK